MFRKTVWGLLLLLVLYVIKGIVWGRQRTITSDDGSKIQFREYFFRNGKFNVRHGRYTSWYPNGQKEEEVFISNGDKLIGMGYNWYKNGQVSSILKYSQDGHRDSTHTYFDYDGQKIAVEHYKNNQPTRRWFEWNHQGKLIKNIDYDSLIEAQRRKD